MSDTVRIIGAPADYGANRRGVDMGPSAIRYADLARKLERSGVETEDWGDLSTPRPEVRDPDVGTANAKFLDEIEALSWYLADEVADAIDAGTTPLVLGGDHSVAIGSMAGSARDTAIGVVWFDAHGDFNTPSTSPSGNVHGMPLAAALGRDEFGSMPWAQALGLSEENVAIVGLRDLDSAERDAIRDSDVTAFTMSDVDERGITAVVDDALAAAGRGVDGVHVSFDLDFLDPVTAPGVGTPVRGGATYREAHAAMEGAAESGLVRSLDLVEVNPVFDERNETAELAAGLAGSAFGTRTL